MKINKTLIEKYNSPDTLGVVSLYPKKGEVYSRGVSGVASYAKNIISNFGRRVIVFCDYKNKPSFYEEGRTLVIGCFKKNSQNMWEEIYKYLKKFDRVNNLLLQFDFALYGNIFTSSLAAAFIMLLKLLGYRISITCHTVLTDVRKISGHIGLKNNLMGNFKANIYTLVFKLFYKTISTLSDQIIVLEENLKIKLQNLTNSKNIFAINHGVDNTLTPISKNKARKILGIGKKEHLVLFFGYVNWFKGADFFVNSFTKTEKILGKKVNFVIAGGKSATLSGKKYYEQYFESIKSSIKLSKSIKITGYVSQKRIPVYFSAADLIILPYRHFMMASGVLSLALSFKKPFIISKESSPVLESTDFIESLSLSNLKKEEIVFDLNSRSLNYLTKKVLKNGTRKKIIKLAYILRNKRDYKNTALQYENLIFAERFVLKTKPALSYAHFDLRKWTYRK